MRFDLAQPFTPDRIFNFSQRCRPRMLVVTDSSLGAVAAEQIDTAVEVASFESHDQFDETTQRIYPSYAVTPHTSGWEARVRPALRLAGGFFRSAS